MVNLTIVYAACNASSTTRGLQAVTISKALAAPSGSRRFCSQFCTVRGLTPINSANCSWLNPKLPRI